MGKQITFRTLDQKSFSVEATDDDTILELKEKLTASPSAGGKAVSKLIYSGKVLDDAKTVGSYGIEEGKGFVVVMFAKAKPAPKSAPEPAAASAPTPAAAAAPSTSTLEDASMSAPVTDGAPTEATTEAVPATGGEAAPSGGNASFLSGDALQGAIANMMEMGFPKEDIMRALRASFNNPERAVEYLMTGIPAGLEAVANGPAAPAAAPAAPVPSAAASAPPVPAVPAPAAAAAAPVPAGNPENLFAAAQAAMAAQPASGSVAAARGPGATAAAAPGADAAEGLGLGDPATLQQLRQMVQQNPALIAPLMQQLAQTHPELVQALQENPEALFQLLGGAGEGEGDEWEQGDFGEAGQGGANNVVQVTEEERGAIERLEALGFPRQVVLEAFLLCDRNEELAANFLFDNAGFDQ